jgi:sugar/nucleoside kinase (ribokinase family)
LKLVVVGSVALDTVETPFGKVEDALGGSATYFSLAARHFSPVGVVGVVGDDFPAKHVAMLRDHQVDTTGLTTEPGRTFRWSGRYDFDLNTAHTLDTQMNVFAGFRPNLPESYRAAGFLFLGNIDPALQLDVLEQVQRPQFIALDTMNYWISSKPNELTEVIKRVDAVLINEAEARQYANTPNLLKAARDLMALGPTVVVVKKGEYGCVLFAEGCYFVTPAYPLEVVRDPTGAGDSFAGAFVGYLARRGDVSESALRRAIVHGSVVASYTCEDFSVERLKSLDAGAIAARYAEFRHITYFEDESET